MNIRISLLVSLLLLSACTDTASETASAPARQPNIVLILVDDLGYADLGVTGGDIDTPNIDRLAGEGLFFSQFYNNAKCSQTRASLLSGLYYQQARKQGPKGNLGHDQLAQGNHTTLAEVLRDAGYATAAAGKWHLSGTPYEHGFDDYYGYLEGAQSHWDDSRVFGTYKDEAGTYYSTDNFTEAGLAFIEQAVADGKPVFLYLAYTAPHYPLHAHAEDIARYEGRFDGGWDAVRDHRVARMRETGLIEPGFEVAGRLTGAQDWDAAERGWDWQDYEERERGDQGDLMETYAAMVHRIDWNVGRLLERLESLGIGGNTLIFFLSDNGGSPYPNQDDPDTRPGPPGSWRTLNTAWANVNSAPFRLFKRFSHEGGIATPMIAYWPNGIEAAGRTSAEPFHVIDFMPTLVELAGADYPASRYGDPVLPMAGRSFAPVLGNRPTGPGRPLFWEYQDNYAVREGKWKLVQSNLDEVWELYDIEADRGETKDLADRHPDVVRRLQAEWQAWMETVSAHRAFPAPRSEEQ